MKPSLPKFAVKALLLFTVCFSLLSKSNAQGFIFGNERTKWEVGLNFGPSFFLGDLGGHHGKGTNDLKDLNLNFTKLMNNFSIYLEYKLCNANNCINYIIIQLHFSFEGFTRIQIIQCS